MPVERQSQALRVGGGREGEVRRQWKIEKMKDLTLELVRQHAA